jgi:hypothetical protein
VIWVLFSPSQTRSGDPTSLPKDSFFQLIESTMKKIWTAMVNERGRVIATGSATFRLQNRMLSPGIVRSLDDASPVDFCYAPQNHSGADKRVDAQLSSTSEARLAKGTAWFGTTPGPLGRLEALLSVRLPTGT